MTDPGFTNPCGPERESLKSIIADLARPFAIYVSSAGASIATVIIALKVQNFSDSYLFIGAVFGGVSALYIGRAWENSQVGKHAATVEIAKASSTLEPEKAK